MQCWRQSGLTSNGERSLHPKPAQMGGLFCIPAQRYAGYGSTMTTLFLTAFFVFAQLITLDARDMDLGDFLRFLGNVAGMHVVLHPAAQGKVNLMVKEALWEQVVDVVLKTHSLAKARDG